MPRIHLTELKAGISPTPEFEKKGLAAFAVNIGTKCSHGCSYCSTGSVLFRHKSFKQAGESPFQFGYAIVDKNTPERVAADARRVRLDRRGLVQLCTTVDAWAPEAQQYDIGRRCLEALLAEPGWTVRVLTKNAAVAKDFDLIERHRDRVLVGLSLTAAPDKATVMAVVEPNASSIPERIEVLREAAARGLRTYAMLCPLLPGIADTPEAIAGLVDLGISVGAEEYFVEPVNGRGPGLAGTERALREAGFIEEADAVSRIRDEAEWSAYTARLLQRVQETLTARGAVDRLRFLLYPSRLAKEDVRAIRAHPDGVRWLGPKKRKSKRRRHSMATKTISKASTPQRAATRLAQHQTAALKAKIEPVKKALRDADSKDAGARYKVGKLVLDIEKNKKVYGANAVLELEKQLGLDAKTLYKYARVVEAWPQKEFGDLRKKTNRKGLKLTWSHYELIAQRPAAQRERLLKAALGESVSVHDLQLRIQRAKPTGPVDQLRKGAEVLVKHASESKRAISSMLSATLAAEEREDAKALLTQWQQVLRLAGEVTRGLQMALGESAPAGPSLGAGRMIEVGIAPQAQQPAPAMPAPAAASPVAPATAAPGKPTPSPGQPAPTTGVPAPTKP